MAVREGAVVIGRYALYDELARGGMATVHLGRLLGPGGFSRIVAIKRLHPSLAANPDVAEMFRQEGRLSARIRHANVVPVLDVIATGAELLLVMDYVHGESLSRLLDRLSEEGTTMDISVATAIAIGVLRGLDAAHGATDDAGTPLGIVHRDVSPQNVIVGADGAARVLDFGIAQSSSAEQGGRRGRDGKVAYMAPEQLAGHAVDARTDVWAASVVLWEMLTAERLFDGTVEETEAQIRNEPIEPPSSVRSVPERVEAVVMRGLSRAAEERHPSARAMADALEAAIAPATAGQVATWLDGVAHDVLETRRGWLERIERTSAEAPVPSRFEQPTEIETVSARARPRGLMIAAVFVVLVLAVGAFAAFARHRDPPGEPIVPAPTTAPASATPALAISAVPSPPEIASDAAVATSSPTAKPRPKPKPAASPAPRTPSCDPPWTVGPAPDFVKRPKIECLNR